MIIVFTDRQLIDTGHVNKTCPYLTARNLICGKRELFPYTSFYRLLRIAAANVLLGVSHVITNNVAYIKHMKSEKTKSKLLRFINQIKLY